MGILMRRLMMKKILQCVPLSRVLALVAFALLQFFAIGSAQAQGADFDHNSTGFVLDIRHQEVRCETCHTKGQFKGTPKDCASCHGWTNPRAKSAVMPTNHIPTRNLGCETCHTAALAQFADAARNFSHALVVGQTCTDCHSSRNPHPGVRTNPKDAVHTAALTAGKECGVCHSTIQFVGQQSQFHIPFNPNSSCESCHVSSDYGIMPSIMAIHANAPSTSSNCAQCHSTANAAQYNRGRMMPAIVSPPANHISMGSQSCEACHVGSNSSLMLPVVDGSKFGNSAFNHAGITVSCASCHGANVVAGTFYGVQPKTMSGLTPAHVPTTAACESCHINSVPTGLVSLLGAVGGQATFAGGQFSHSGITSGCDSCHGASVSVNAYYGIKLKTISGLVPAHVPTTAACEVCHAANTPSMLIAATGATGAMTTFAGGKFSHSGITTGCSTCHGAGINGNTFYGISNIVVLPSTSNGGHIPAPNNASCETCHLGSVPAGLINANAAGSGNTGFFNPLPTGVQIHSGVTGSCSSCHETGMSWLGTSRYPKNPSVKTAGGIYNGFHTRPIGGGSATAIDDINHPFNGDCSQCHSSTVSFSGQALSANHIPFAASATCDSCHGDFSVLPTVAKIHANIQSTSTNCAQCHSTANAARYSANIKNPIVTVPSGHISMGTLGCESCHVGAGSSIASTPVPDGAKFSNSLFNHSGTTVACSVCHGADVTPSTFVGVYPKTISSLAPAHVPTTAACDVCHVNSVPSGLVPAVGMTTFAGGKFTHNGITTGCSTCHGAGINGTTFYGISNILVLPSTSNGGHIPAPNNASCEACHLASVPSGLINANAATSGNSGFFAPLPNGVQIHSGVTGSCASCHETGMTWLGTTRYPKAPSIKTAGATYTGFHTRPISGGSATAINDGNHPLTGDCSQCHGSTANFSGQALPSGHIPFAASATCDSCHGDFSAPPSNKTLIHSKIQSTTGNCAQCHSETNAALYAGTTKNFPIKTPAANHIPMGALGCETCHVAANTTNWTSFANGSFSHSGITGNCSSCHGVNVVAGTFDGVTPKGVAGLTPIHVPVSNNVGCDTCHVNSIPSMLIPATGATGAMTTFAGGKFSHTLLGDGVTCATCHGPSVTSGSFKGITNIIVMPATSPAGPSSHIPTNTTCENCHMGSVPSGLVAANATATIGGTGFRNPAPSASMIHAGVTASCNSCHDAGGIWVGMDKYPITTTAPYLGFQTRPRVGVPTSTSQFFVRDDLHPRTGDCALCHSTTSFDMSVAPVGHIPYKSTATCSSCHISFGAAPAIGLTHQNIQSTTTNCVQCHSTANAALYAATTTLRPIKTPSSVTNHIDTGTLSCESCHMGTGTGIPSAIGDASTFGGGLFSHNGLTQTCATCHANGITGSSFYGVTQIVAMPSSATPGPTAHIPTSATCESCHAGSKPTGLLSVTTPRSLPGSGFMTPAPTSVMIHASVSGSCSSCHEKDMRWIGMNQYAFTTTAPIKGFHTRPYGSPLYTASTVNDASHPTGGDCSSCHSGFNEWLAQVKPSNHIPTANVACAACHTAPSYSTMPTLTNIHANIQSTTTNCVQCHSATNAALYNTTAMTIKAPATNHIPMGALGCESCHMGANSSITTATVRDGALFTNSAFSHSGITKDCAVCHGDSVTSTTFEGSPVIKTMLGLSPIHVPSSQTCELCHQTVPTGLSKINSTSATFATNSKFSHSGITTGCATCHGAGVSGTSFYGITRIVVLSNYNQASGANSHIPAPNNASCESCHAANTPAGLFSPNATAAAVTWGGNSGFFTPAPTGSQIHSGVSSVACSVCHESGMTWTGLSKYPRTPTTFVAGATYTGFHARPVNSGTALNSVTDSNHPSTGDCSQCHGSTASFSVTAMPSNHIPISATAACTVCHTNITATNRDFSVHPTNALIHQYGPTTTVSDCAQCHSVTNAAKYAIPSASFSIKAPATNHVPFGTTNCTVCHTAAASTTTYTSFANGLYSHSGVTSGCATCHASTVTAFQGIPLTSLVVAANNSTQGNNSHIPFSLSVGCEVCHAGSTPTAPMAIPATKPAYGSTLFRTPIPTSAMIHSGITASCQTCHEKNYLWQGVGNYPISPTTMVANAQYRGFQTRPFATATTYSVADSGHEATGLGVGTDCALCHVGFNAFTGEGKPAGHLPTTPSGITTCSTCHITPGDYAVNTLASHPVLHGTMSSAFVKYTAATIGTKSCANCHAVGTGGTSGTAPFAGCALQSNCTSPPPITYQPMTVAGVAKHVPIKTLDCNGCHVGSFTSFSGVNMKSGTNAASMHSNATLAGIQCQQCHENGMSWTNVNNLLTRTPSKHTTANRMAPNDCAGCHTFNGGFRAAVRPVMRGAMISPELGRVKPSGVGGIATRGVLGNNFDHQGVEPAKCKTCHDGKKASGTPGRHLMVMASCDTCHSTSAWTPAQFSHIGITPNTCLACHNGMGASRKPSGHFMTGRSCDSCHKTTGWSPVAYTHTSPSYKPGSEPAACITCHVTNSEIIPRQMRALNRVKPVVGN
jgi:hypothetical protein